MTTLEDLKRNFYRDGTDKLHWGKISSSIVVVIVLIAFLIYKNGDMDQKNKDRLANRRYTIGTTGKKHHNIKSSKPTVEFHYNVLLKEYKDIAHIDAQYEKTVVPNGGRYFVEFSLKDPSNSKLLLSQPVPSHIQSSPDSGWSDLVGSNYN
jgi:hypothetical protein